MNVIPDEVENLTIGQVSIYLIFATALIALFWTLLPKLGTLNDIRRSLLDLPQFMREARAKQKEHDEILKRLCVQIENDHTENLRDEITNILVAVQELSEKVCDR